MRKVLVLLGLAAVLAAGIALFLVFGGTGADPARASDRTAAVVQPGAAGADAGGAELDAAGPIAPETQDGSAREVAHVTPQAKLGAERVVPAETEESGDELYGLVLGIYGVPVGGADVKVEAIGSTADGLLQVLGGSTDKETVTKKDGTFRVPRPDRWEEVRVTIDARGFLDFSRSMDLVDKSGDQDLGVFELEGGVVLGGKVLDADGQPVAGANVRRVDNEEESYRFRSSFGVKEGVDTDADGRFELPHEEPGDYLLVVEHDDHPTGRFPGTTPPAGGEDTSLVLRLPRGATIAGEIHGFPTGREHVRVSAQVIDPNADKDTGYNAVLEESGFSVDGLEADAEKNGSFEIKGLEVGKNYRVRAFVRGGFFGRTAASEEREVRAGDQGVELTWDAGGSLLARVVDEATAAAVPEVEVRYRWDSDDDSLDFSNQTRQRKFRDGKVELTELRPRDGQRTLSLLLSAPGYLDLRHEHVAIEDGGEVDVGTIRMRRAPIVRVTVLDPEGEPVSRARVRLAPEETDEGSGGMRGPAGWFSLDKKDAIDKTGSDGVVELPAPATPTARLEVSHPRYSGYVRAGVPMPSEGAQEEEVHLADGGTIEVSVVDTQGNPVPDVRVRHRYPPEALEDDTATHETNRGGKVRLRNQLAGMHGFRPDEDRAKDGEEPEWKDVAVADGRTTKVVLEVPVRATLEGKITEAGTALDRATVSLVEVDESVLDEVSVNVSIGGGGRSMSFGPTRASDRTDRLGRYSLEDVPAGTYRLKVTHEDRAAPHFVPVTVHGGPNRLDVDVPVNAVEGRVTDATGGPLAGAALRLIPTKGDGAKDQDLERQALMELFGNGRSSVTTGADGSYRLRGVPTDRPFRVEASKEGYIASRSDEVTVRPGEVRGKVDVTLRSGGVLRVRVTGDASPFTFLRARWDGGGDDPPKEQVVMVRRGEAVFQGLEPGPWMVGKGNGDGGNEQRFDVLPSGETVVDFTL